MKNSIERKLHNMTSDEVITLYLQTINDIDSAISKLKDDPDEADIESSLEILQKRRKKHNSLSWSN